MTQTLLKNTIPEIPSSLEHTLFIHQTRPLTQSARRLSFSSTLVMHSKLTEGEMATEIEKPANLYRSRVLFELSEPLLQELRLHRENQKVPSAIENDYDAFVMTLGLGVGTYLTSDGRMLWDDYGFWEVDGTLRYAYLGVAVGILSNNIESLRDLLPSRPRRAVDCERCESSGVLTIPFATGARSFPCHDCAGLGWVSKKLKLDKNVLDGPPIELSAMEPQ